MDEVLEQTNPEDKQAVVLPKIGEGVVLQQVSPALFPQTPHTPETHFVPDEVQSVPVVTTVLVLVEQQGRPGPPQVPHTPAEHVPGTGEHVFPLPTQTLETQQPPPAQALPAQHCFPSPPHVVVEVEVLVDVVVVDPPVAGIPPTTTMPPVGVMPASTRLPPVTTKPPKLTIPPVTTRC